MELVLYIFSLLLIRSKAENEFIDLTSDEFQLKCLNYHNILREKHCSHNLKYSPKLTLFAKRRATEMAKQDGKNFGHLPNLPFGENIIWLKRKNVTTISCKDIVNKWYAEKNNYDWYGHYLDRTSGHFTQLIWNSTEKVGCAIALSKGPIGGIFAVCNYYPFGNNIHLNQKNVMSVEKCDAILSKRKFEYKVLTNSEWLQECIDEHNKLRIINEDLPLIVDNNCVKYANMRAIDMAQKGFRFFRHSNQTKFGENIHWGKSANTTTQGISCKIPLKIWYKEVDNYNWFNRNRHFGTVRHFSQLVWRSTRYMGCAQVQSIGDPKGGIYSVCEYFPPADHTNLRLQLINILSTLPVSTATTELASVTVTVKAHDYEDTEEGIDDETELEKEFKDFDDVIESKIEYRKQTEAPSLEDLLKSSSISPIGQEYNAFSRNTYMNKQEIRRRKL